MNENEPWESEMEILLSECHKNKIPNLYFRNQQQILTAVNNDTDLSNFKRPTLHLLLKKSWALCKRGERINHYDQYRGH
jgi:hypothetical protein